MKPSLQLAEIHLRVANLARILDFYVAKLGFILLGRSEGRATLATSAHGPGILTLQEDASAPAPVREAAGLFHAALLFPGRGALGAWLQFAAAAGVEFEGLSDHGVSEALYFSDPEGNGLEFYADRASADWPRVNGQLAMDTQPLDWRDLVSAAAPSETAPLTGASWGHLHLRVTNLERSEAFYMAQLGVAVTQGNYPGARFLAADGYHHHVAINTWGHPRQPKRPDALGLTEVTFAVPGTTTPRSLGDPDGIALRVVGP